MYSQFQNPRIVSGWDSLSELSQLAGRRAALITDAGVLPDWICNE
jgi:hypothetical protein